MSKKNSNESDSKELKINHEQLALLRECSHKKDMTKWNEKRRKNPDEKIWLQGAEISGVNLIDAKFLTIKAKKKFIQHSNLNYVDYAIAHLENANLAGAHLENAELGYSNLKGADLFDAHLENANLEKAHLENADLMFAHLENANFEAADVNGATLIWNCEIDHKTNFEGVSLGNARIEPETRQLLEYNIRRLKWEKWYKKHLFLKWLVRWFWYISNYGISTWRIIICFFCLALLFAAIYANFAYWWPLGIVSDLTVEPHLPIWHYFLLLILRPVYFSVVTMTTLGFGDMYASAQSLWGHLLLIIQVLLGYVLLAALVTRFAVLFTAGGPAGKFAKRKKK